MISEPIFSSSWGSGLVSRPVLWACVPAEADTVYRSNHLGLDGLPSRYDPELAGGI